METQGTRLLVVAHENLLQVDVHLLLSSQRFGVKAESEMTPTMTAECEEPLRSAMMEDPKQRMREREKRRTKSETKHSQMIRIHAATLVAPFRAARLSFSRLQCLFLLSSSFTRNSIS